MSLAANVAWPTAWRADAASLALVLALHGAAAGLYWRLPAPAPVPEEARVLRVSLLSSPEEPEVRLPQPPLAKSPPSPTPAPAPTVASTPPPAYPRLSRRLGEEGRVWLKVLVTPEGAAGVVEIHESSGHARLDLAACQTVRHWRFDPARQEGRTLAAWVLIPMTFSLRG